MKAEYTARIKELEKEFSDEEFAEFFRVEGEDAEKTAEQVLQKRNTRTQESILATVLAVCIVFLFIYLLSLV